MTTQPNSQTSRRRKTIPLSNGESVVVGGIGWTTWKEIRSTVVDRVRDEQVRSALSNAFAGEEKHPGEQSGLLASDTEESPKTAMAFVDRLFSSNKWVDVLFSMIDSAHVINAALSDVDDMLIFRHIVEMEPDAVLAKCDSMDWDIEDMLSIREGIMEMTNFARLLEMEKKFFGRIASAAGLTEQDD